MTMAAVDVKDVVTVVHPYLLLLHAAMSEDTRECMPCAPPGP